MEAFAESGCDAGLRTPLRESITRFAVGCGRGFRRLDARFVATRDEGSKGYV